MCQNKTSIVGNQWPVALKTETAAQLGWGNGQTFGVSGFFGSSHLAKTCRTHSCSCRFAAWVSANGLQWTEPVNCWPSFLPSRCFNGRKKSINTLHYMDRIVWYGPSTTHRHVPKHNSLWRPDSTAPLNPNREVCTPARATNRFIISTGPCFFGLEQRCTSPTMIQSVSGHPPSADSPQRLWTKPIRLAQTPIHHPLPIYANCWSLT